MAKIPELEIEIKQIPSPATVGGYTCAIILLSIAASIFTQNFMTLDFVQTLTAENRLLQERMVHLERTMGIEDVAIVTVTGYSPRVRETDSTPRITASNEHVREGGVAVSHDLKKAGWWKKFIIIPCKTRKEARDGHCGRFWVNDTMNRRYKKRVDIFFKSTAKARKCCFGKIKRKIEHLSM